MPENVSAAGVHARSRFNLLGLVAVMLVTVIAFAPALRAPFIFDDEAIENESGVTALWPPWTALHGIPQGPLRNRPVVNYTFAINSRINRALGINQDLHSVDPNFTLGFHLFNLAIHLLSGVLLFGILRRTVGRLGGWTVERSSGVALLVTAIWLVHPLQSDAVNYVVQRTELLVSLCVLGTLYSSVRAWDAATAMSRTRWYIAGVVSCLLGMGSKEVMFSAPVMVMLYDRAFRLDSWRDLSTPAARGRVPFYFGLFATLLLLFGQMVSSPASTSIGFSLGVSWLDYLLTQGWAISHYLLLSVWPSALTLDYGSRPITDWRGAAGLALLAILGAGTLWAWKNARKWGWLGFCGAWFFALLGPSSSFVPIVTEMAAERRMHLALAAVVMLIVVGGVELIRRSPALVRPSLAGAPLLVGVLAVLTFRRSEEYRDPVVLWRQSTAQRPDNPRAFHNLGIAIVRSGSGTLEQADSMFLRALAIDSTYTRAYFSLAENERRRNHNAEAEAYLKHLLAIGPNDYLGLEAMASALLAQDKGAEALPYLERVTENATHPEPFVNVGKLQLALDHLDDAVRSFERALAIDTTRKDVKGMLGSALLAQGKADRAIPYLEAASTGDSVRQQDLAKLSLAAAQLGRAEEALSAAHAALEGSPDDPLVLFDLGRAMMASKRFDLAETYLLKAAQLVPKNSGVVAALGIAKAQLGKSREAAALLRYALQLDPANEVAREALKSLR